MSPFEMPDTSSNKFTVETSQPSSMLLEAHSLFAKMEPSRTPGGVSAVVTDLAEGAADEVLQHPLHVAEQVMIGAGLAAAATLLAPEVGAALGVAALGAAAYGLYENAGNWFQSAAIVSGYQSSSPESVQGAHNKLKDLGADAADLAATALGGGIIFGRIAPATARVFMPDSPLTPPPGALRTAIPPRTLPKGPIPPRFGSSGEPPLNPPAFRALSTRDAALGPSTPKMHNNAKTAQNVDLNTNAVPQSPPPDSGK